MAKNPPDLVARTTAVIGTLLGLSGLWLSYSNYRWQQNTYQESHEESPRIHGTVTQKGKQINSDKNGALFFQITNLGKRTMQIKMVTLSGWNRVWILYMPPEKTTFDVEPGCNLWTQTPWDYEKYPIDMGQSPQPADFLVTVETTRAVHQQHVFINQFMPFGVAATKDPCGW